MEGLISGRKKCFEMTHSSHNKATLSPVQYCHSVEGGLQLEVFFCFQVDGPITRGLISGILRYLY